MRIALACSGCAVLLFVWFGPLPALVPGHFAAHMTMHMGVVAVAAPLLSLSVAAGAYDPVRRWPQLFPPLPASVVELIAVWAWHAPTPHAFARGSLLGACLEQSTFLASGLLLWLAALGGTQAQRCERSAQGALALLLTSMHMTLLGALLALPPRPLYAHAAHAGPDALSDQHLGGAIMLIVGCLVYLAGGLALAATLLRRVPAERAP